MCTRDLLIGLNLSTVPVTVSSFVLIGRVVLPSEHFAQTMPEERRGGGVKAEGSG